MNTNTYQNRHWPTAFLCLLLAACQTAPVQEPQNLDSITTSLEDGIAANESLPEVTTPPEVAEALIPPIQVNLDEIVDRTKPRFDVSVNAASAHEFFMSLVKGTDNNMVVHPDVNGEISLTLRNVTIDEILMTVRDMYGYEFRHSNNTYQVFPGRMRTQVYSVNYLDLQRSGISRTLVSSGQKSNSDNGNANGTTTPSTAANTNDASRGGGVSGSVVRTDSDTDFWKGLAESLSLIVGSENGRKVVVHPQTGVVVVHAMPGELRDVADFLASIQDSAHRVVILEAKIIEVELNDRFQSGINWTALINISSNKSILLGQTGGGSIFDTGVSELEGAIVPLDGTRIEGLATSAFGGMFSIAANLNNFNAFIELLETQGDVQVLSSPRVSTVNNQKAVIKVGQDEYFVTDVETDTDTTDGVLNQTVDVTLTPFFSGVALDVIPQIDDQDNVLLHIHPSVSDVTEEIKDITVSSNTDLSIPLALSTIRESDSVIRAKSGQMVVIGGLMKDISRDKRADTPILSDLPGIGSLFAHKQQISVKSELVILLRPVVINTGRQWNTSLRDAADRYRDMRLPSDDAGNTSGQVPPR